MSEPRGEALTDEGHAEGSEPRFASSPGSLSVPEQTIAEARDPEALAKIIRERWNFTHKRWSDEAYAALAALVARAAAAEAERDKALRYEHDYRDREADQRWEATLHRAERAEAETQRLREALLEIAQWQHTWSEIDFEHSQAVARTALALSGVAPEAWGGDDAEMRQIDDTLRGGGGRRDGQ